MSTTTMQDSLNQTEKMLKNLSKILANTYVIYVKTQNFHWNTKGPRFQQLHLFFEKQYTTLSNLIDEVAEQVRILQGRPPSSMREFLDLSIIEESKGELSEDDMLNTLLSDHEKILSLLASAIQEAQKNKDEGTADLLISQLRTHQKITWMIRSHLD